MISYDLVMAICLVMAVGVVGAAIVWALLETRHESAHRHKRPLSRHLKAHKHPFKAQDK
jgi:hypothetical protein